MTAITCYGGVGSIGGNKILLEDGDVRLFFDFGIDFGLQGAFFNEYLRPRASRGLLDLLALGLIPPLEGLYREDLALPTLWERFRAAPLYRNLRRDGPPVDGVLVSHAHLDHNGDISYLDCAIPVHARATTAFVARAMQITGVSNFEREITFISPRIEAETGELVSDRKGAYACRPHHFLEGPLSDAAAVFWAEGPATKKGFAVGFAGPCEGKVGNLEVRWWPLDHSIPGATGYAVRTSAGWIAYTGDIRFHGKHGAASWQFAHDLRALHPTALLCEGTHIHAGRHQHREADVVANASGLLRAAKGKLVVADFGPRNVERLESFLEIARASERALVILPKDAYLLRAIALAAPEAYLAPETMPGLELYADPKAAPRPWERTLRDAWPNPLISPHDISRHPGDYVLCFSLWDANDLLDLTDVAGGAYIYSSSKAYDDEQRVDLERLRNWVRYMGFALHGDPDDPNCVPLHASGHACGPELVDFVTTVHPEMLIPIHTEEPDWWDAQLAGSGIEVRKPVAGKKIMLA